MTVVRAVARPLLAASFITQGIDALIHPRPRAERAQPLADHLAERTPAPASAELVVRGTGLLAAGSGLLLASGKAPRLAGLGLAVSLIPATYVDYPFWTEKNIDERREMRRGFVRNLGLLGGSMLAVVDTQGKPGVAWLGRHAVARTQAELDRAGREARFAGRLARRQARLQARDVMRSAQLTAKDAQLKAARA